MPQDNSQPLTVDQAGAAKLVGVSARHFRELAKAGLVPPCVNLGGRLRRWHIGTLQSWLAAGGVQVPSATPTIPA